MTAGDASFRLIYRYLISILNYVMNINYGCMWTRLKGMKLYESGYNLILQLDSSEKQSTPFK